MMRLLVVYLLFCITSQVLCQEPKAPSVLPPMPGGVTITAGAGILMDRRTGIVLWAHNPDLPLPMASLTKVMTAMVILDHGRNRLQEKASVSYDAAAIGGSSALAQGDVLTLEDLLKAALIASSNEATLAAAEYLATSKEEFIYWMNAKAKAIGCTHTHFLNTHGLLKGKLAQEHYSTARDQAIITRYALTHYPLIRKTIVMGIPPEIVVIPVIPQGGTKTIKRYLTSRDESRNKPVPGVPGSVIDGVKTGYTAAAGKCLISSATLKDWQLIAVVLNSTDPFADNQALLRYGFTNFDWQTYASAEQPGISLPVTYGAPGVLPIGTREVLGAPIQRMGIGARTDDRLVLDGPPLKAPILDGQELGTLTLLRNGRAIAHAPAIALDHIRVAWWVRALLGVGCTALVLGLLVLLNVLHGTRTKNARRLRRQLAAKGRSPGHGRPGYGER